MTLLDAPKYDAVGAKRRVRILLGLVAFLFVLIVAGWFVAGRPLDMPWAWWNDGMAHAKVNTFFKAVEEKDMAKAYAVWNADKDWQQHPLQYKNYDFNRFQQDWAPMGSENDYGIITSHKITIEKQSGNIVIVCVYINGRKTPVFLSVDNATRSVGFSPNELYVGP